MNTTRRLALYALLGLLIAIGSIATINFTLPSIEAKTGTLVISVENTLTPTGTAPSKIYLTVDQIMVHRVANATANDTGEWFNYTVPDTTVELLSLHDIGQSFPQLATAKLPVGSYNLLWLRIVSATANFGNGNETLKVPSGVLKIPQVRFTVTQNGVVDILIDLGTESVHIAGDGNHLNLRPVAHLLSHP